MYKQNNIMIHGGSPPAIEFIVPTGVTAKAPKKKRIYAKNKDTEH